MAVRNRVNAIPLTSFAASSLTTGYQLVNTNGLPNACFLLRITNASDRDITISYNGTTDHEFIATSVGLDAINLNAQTNAQPQNYTCLFPKGMKVYVKAASAGSGVITVSGYYQENEN